MGMFSFLHLQSPYLVYLRPYPYRIPFTLCYTADSTPFGEPMPESYSEAAVRHFSDADHLAAGQHLDGAGYLIGYAVECAIKSAVENMRPTADAPHLHLPTLVEKAKKALQGRRKHSVFTVLERPGFMAGWAVSLRYEADMTIDAETFKAWRADASRTISAAGLKRKTT
jgi:hypothetical protein